jgi:hypothetical protein
MRTLFIYDAQNNITHEEQHDSETTQFHDCETLLETIVGKCVLSIDRVTIERASVERRAYVVNRDFITHYHYVRFPNIEEQAEPTFIDTLQDEYHVFDTIEQARRRYCEIVSEALILFADM